MLNVFINQLRDIKRHCLSTNHVDRKLCDWYLHWHFKYAFFFRLNISRKTSFLKFSQSFWFSFTCSEKCKSTYVKKSFLQIFFFLSSSSSLSLSYVLTFSTRMQIKLMTFDFIFEVSSNRQFVRNHFHEILILQNFIDSQR